MYAKLVVKVFEQLIELWILANASAWCAGCRAGPRSLLEITAAAKTSCLLFPPSQPGAGAGSGRETHGFAVGK